MSDNKKIILVEDDFIIGMLLEKQILRMGYEVAAKVDSGEEAIERVREENPELVLMDIKLVGDIDGIEAMETIREFSSVPVIYLTGNADSNTRARAEKTGPEGYLIKPVDMKILREKILKIMDGQQK